MHSFGESPISVMTECRVSLEHRNAVGESHLSQILTDTVPERFYLSEKACLGILRRSVEKGKELPELLRTALEHQATRSRSGGGREVDSLGKRAGKGALIQTELSGTLGVSQDQTLFSPVTHTHTQALTQTVSSLQARDAKGVTDDQNLKEGLTKVVLTRK